VLQVVADEPVPPRQLQPKTPQDLETVCLKCLEKEPARRYGSALELAEDVRAFLEDRPIRARPVGSAERSWRWCRRNPAVAGLLAAVFGVLLLGTAVSTFFAVRASREAEAARATGEQVIDTQYRERCRREEARLDYALLLQAQTLAQLVQFHVGWGRLRYRSLNVLGLLSAAPSPGGYVLAPAWAGQGFHGPFSHHYRMKFAEITEFRLDQDDRLLPVDKQVAEYYQIDSAWGNSYRSPSMGQRSFPMDPATFAPKEVLHWEFDDTTLGPDLRVRRVRLKAPLAQLVPVILQRQGLSSDLPPGPAIYIQWACPTDRRDAALLAFRERRDADLATFTRESSASQASLRDQLLTMSTITLVAAALGGLFTLVAATLGGLWLVWLGLAPLRRLRARRKAGGPGPR
jgi:hypothetical protein